MILTEQLRQFLIKSISQRNLYDKRVGSKALESQTKKSEISTYDYD